MTWRIWSECRLQCDRRPIRRRATNDATTDGFAGSGGGGVRGRAWYAPGGARTLTNPSHTWAAKARGSRNSAYLRERREERRGESVL